MLKATLNKRIGRSSGARNVSWSATAPSVKPTPIGKSRTTALLELGLSVSGAGLAVFMVAHEALHFTILLGVSVYDSLADFMERYYLLHGIVPPLVVFFFGHVFLAARKTPTAYWEQMVLLRHARSLRHFDTWTWVTQVLTGVGVFVLGSIHVWVILADLPIDASKSSTRIFDIYLWNYAPFIVLVQTHLSVGLYRIAVKWWPVPRRVIRGFATAWLIAAVSLGFAILVAFYFEGGSQ